ncbi:MAG: hypothetical protein LC792_27425, partial [Actinobacteria bacterium]|nr:hypothetical protein [Actinomycetota bacterium]
PYKVNLTVKFTTDAVSPHPCIYVYGSSYEPSPWCSYEPGFEGVASLGALALVGVVLARRRR